METARERALSFLHRQRDQAPSFAGQHGDEEWRERDASAAGAVGALRAVGLLSPEEAETWKSRLLHPADERPTVFEDARRRAAEVLGELLYAVPTDDEETSVELNRFEGACHALAHVGAAGDEWDERLRQRLGRPSAEQEQIEIRELNAGGTEQDLLAVLAGPAEAVDGVRVVYGLRFADGVSFVIHRERAGHGWDDWDVELRDDVGTTYFQGGFGGGDGEQHINFRTAPPAEASWIELVGLAESPIRLVP